MIKDLISNQLSSITNLSDIDLNIVFDGNSLTEGINGSGIDQYYPKEVQSWLSGRVKSLTFNSFGLSGQALKEMIIGAPAKIDVLIDSEKENVCVTWEDANGILVDLVPGAENYNDMITYVNARYAAGFDKVIVVTGYYPRLPYDLFTPTQAALDEQHNYFEIANTNNFNIWDATVDLRLNNEIGGGGEQDQDATYYNDYLHLLAAGYDQVAIEVINRGLLQLYHE